MADCDGAFKKVRKHLHVTLDLDVRNIQAELFILLRTNWCKKKELKTNHQPFECWIQNDLKKSNCSSVPLFFYSFVFIYYIFAWTRRMKLTNWLKMLKNTFCHFSFCVCLCMETHTSQETVIFSTRGFHFHLHLLFFAASDIIEMLYCQIALWQYVTYNIIITLNTVFWISAWLLLEEEIIKCVTVIREKWKQKETGVV